MKKRSMRLILTVMCLVLLCSITAFACEDEHESSAMNQYRYVDDIDEYLAQLNSGHIEPHNITKTTFDAINPHTSVNPLAWPWTDCSNILGHKWGGWTTWAEIGPRVHYPSADYCIAFVERWHYCERTYCNAKENERETIKIRCCQ